MPLTTLNDLVLPLRQWSARQGSWCGGDFIQEGRFRLETPLLTSPEFAVEAGRLLMFTLEADFAGACDFVFAVETAETANPLRWFGPKLIHSRLFENVTGPRQRLSLVFRPAKSGRFRLSLRSSIRYPTRSPVAIRAPELTVQAIGAGRISRVPVADLDVAAAPADPYLPHWGRFKRAVHRRCQSSRWFNNLVSAIEMRLAVEEVVSLPQYMALCPTGQCNALCDFCSVTINRTGIIKKQLPFEQVDRLLAPMANTIQYFGLEGNGEPTLYARFPELIDRLSKSSRGVYLITNGSQIKLSDVPLFLSLGSLNFSLNAATAETHRRVMKLRNFNDITAAIWAISRQRGRPGPVSSPMPQIYVTCVVTNHNIHEIQDFVRLAEQELGADIVMVRPLSELGNDIGAVEDLRDIVPYESDIADMIDAVEEYISDALPHTALIRLARETFASVRPDPVGQVRMPAGLEGRLLAPRRAAWHTLAPRVRLDWTLSTGHFVLPAATGRLLQTDPIDIEPGRELIFEAKVTVSGGQALLAVAGDDEIILGSALLTKTSGVAETLRIAVSPGKSRTLAFCILGLDSAATFEIDFGRLRTPARYISTAFRVPEPRRWELCVPEASVNWDGNRVSIESDRGGGPYLLKSYGVPCGRHCLIELPIFAEVREGALSVAVLDGAGTNFLESLYFDEGRTRTSLIFDTGDNEMVRLVVFADPGQRVNGTIYWPTGDIGTKPAIEHRLQPRLPGVSEWRDCGSGATVDKLDGRLDLSWSGTGSPYLAKSNKFWCGANQHVRLPIAVRVSEGKVAVGIIDATESRWLQTHVFEPGETVMTLDFDSGPAGRVAAVITAVEGAPVAMELALTEDGFGPASVPAAPPIVRAPAAPSTPLPAFDLMPQAAAAMAAPAGTLVMREAMPAPSRRSFREWLATTWVRRGWRALRPARPLICQKPWTDLANFTVDGRLDVCCIATGASQTRYQLGNLNRDTFQQIWNGPSAREFRRTVNTPRPLPPCMRCPMQRSFQGLLV